MQAKREKWSGRVGFILSTIGSAIGLGSIWKFPYEVGTNGGGAFIIFYLVGLVLVVLPLLLAEFAIGRRGQSDAVSSIAAAAKESGATPAWRLVGVLGSTTCYLILSFYSVIGGWSFYYIVETIRTGLSTETAAAAQSRFDGMLASPWTMAAFHAAFMALTALIVARGVTGGIERACKLLMPILMLLVIVLATYAMIHGDTSSAVKYLFSIDVRSVSAAVALEALGLGFFSIGVGLAVMITYAGYAGRDIDLREVAIATIIGDTTISCLAGLAVFPIVFANKLNPASGPGLMFVTLPLAFSRLPFGTLLAVSFFVLLAIAAIASAISLLELPVAYLQDIRGWSRSSAVAVAAISCAVCGLLSVLSFSRWAQWHPLAFLGLPKATVFDLLDQLTSNVLLPLGGLALALFAGWVLAPGLLRQELQLGELSELCLRALLRYVVPVAIIAASVAAVRF